jgi:hypothetical protein
MICLGTAGCHRFAAAVAAGISMFAFLTVPVAGATGAIQATATVIQPVGIVTMADTTATPSYFLYCPRQGHVSCAVVFLRHKAQSEANSSLEVQSPIAARTFAGQTASVLSYDQLLVGRRDSDRTCIITLTYTEN